MSPLLIEPSRPVNLTAVTTQSRQVTVQWLAGAGIVQGGDLQQRWDVTVTPGQGVLGTVDKVSATGECDNVFIYVCFGGVWKLQSVMCPTTVIREGHPTLICSDAKDFCCTPTKSTCYAGGNLHHSLRLPWR